MAFSRIKGSGWAVNEILTSAQISALDIDHANAVDKTGDVLSSGTIQLTSAAKIQASIHDSIISSVDSGISTTVSRGVSIQHDTGLVLEGATCWPSFRSNRTRTVIVGPFVTSLSTSGGWTQDGYSVQGPGTSSTAVTFEIVNPHDGATISLIDAVFYVGASHAGVPAVLPTINAYRVQDLTTLAVAPVAPLSMSSAGASAFPTPVSGAAWFASGNIQKWSLTCDQNNVVDRGKYRFVIDLRDESGANSHPGNAFMGFIVHYSAIASMKFQ